MKLAAGLVPNNALMHYDLAVAYVKIGETAAAQSELKVGLDLGLPDEPRRKAIQM